VKYTDTHQCWKRTRTWIQVVDVCEERVHDVEAGGLLKDQVIRAVRQVLAVQRREAVPVTTQKRMGEDSGS
jgi:hypothetical protein